MVEVGAGYTFHWIGKPSGQPRHLGVGFAIRNTVTCKKNSFPKVINDRLKVLRISLADDQHATIISAYAPTMTHTDDVKEAFYQGLSQVINKVSHHDKLIILGNFNDSVGRDHHT